MLAGRASTPLAEKAASDASRLLGLTPSQVVLLLEAQGRCPGGLDGAESSLLAFSSTVWTSKERS